MGSYSKTENVQLGAAEDTCILALMGQGSVSLHVTGTYAGTITFEGTVIGGTWVAMLATPIGSSTSASSTTSTGLWVASATGLSAVRARMSAYTSGSATVTMGASESSPGSVGAASGAAAHVIVDSGTVTAVTAVTAITNALPAGTNSIGTIQRATAASATLANVASSGTSVTLQAGNASRKQWMVFNDSTQVLYVKFGATAAATSYTVQLAAGGYYEMPTSSVVYTGVIDGIWASANGNARVTEI